MKNIGFSSGVHALIKKGAFDNQLSMAKYVHKCVQAFEEERLNKPEFKDGNGSSGNKSYQDLSEVTEKLDLIIEQTKPKTRAKKSVVKVEPKCSIQQIIIDYRKEIKKPLRTEKGLNQLISSIEECAYSWGVSREEVLDYMMRKEWQSIKPDYDNPFVKKVDFYGVANNQSIDDALR